LGSLYFFFRLPDEEPAPINGRSGFADDTGIGGGTSTISWSDSIVDAAPGAGDTSTISWSDSISDDGTSTISWSDSIGNAKPDDGDTSIISWSDSVGGPGSDGACATFSSWSEEDIVDDAGPDGPGGASTFIGSYPGSGKDPVLGGAWSGLDTSDGSSGIDGSGCVRSVHPSAGSDSGELDDGRAGNDSSGCAKWSLEGPKNLSHSSFK
jgi:hypothetical protein